MFWSAPISKTTNAPDAAAEAGRKRRRSRPWRQTPKLAAKLSPLAPPVGSKESAGRQQRVRRSAAKSPPVGSEEVDRSVGRTGANRRSGLATSAKGSPAADPRLNYVRPAHQRLVAMRQTCSMVAALAIAGREPGQALTGAAISGVALCEGRLHRAGRWLSGSISRSSRAFHVPVPRPER